VIGNGEQNHLTSRSYLVIEVVANKTRSKLTTVDVIKKFPVSKLMRIKELREILHMVAIA
jgi:hypothetical protein